MANICSFSMCVKGEHTNIEKFHDALTQASKEIWMGRGADADIIYEDEEHIAYIDGICKWSVNAALILDAMSMKKQKNGGEREWCDIDDVKDFVTIFEACEKFHVNMEVFSEETDLGFEEYLRYVDGEIINETGSYGDFSWEFNLPDVA